ncbi:TonB-dependent receptor [Sphingomonas bisphenolicum]|uniref:TonB-dependent receptor n=2 Tax=Sphingomonas bisphenolicum TaxID=296544 RepID=A0ABN5WJQ1_9SPHN|nr:TonB-dependent receptor [Sphingomonas bisphenolicum]
MIRGVSSKIVGAGLEPPIATYVDGVYIGSPFSTTFSFNNVERIEILKGPQGTLFGRNATGGLIQIVTRDPKQEPGGTMKLSYGNFDTVEGSFYVTGGLTDNLAIDLSGRLSTQGKGWGTNLANGRDVNKLYHDAGIRSKLLFTPTDDLEIRITGDYNDTHNSRFGAQRPPRGFVPPAPYGPAFNGGDWDIASDQQPDFTAKGGGISSRLDYNLGNVGLAAITAYRKSRYHGVFDSDYTAFPGRYAETIGRDEQFSQELQLQSSDGHGFNWTLGAFYYWAEGRFDPIGTITYGTPATPGGVRPATGRFVQAAQGTESIALYGQASAELMPRLNATVGLRYTHEKRDLEADAFTVTPSGITVVTTPEFTSSTKFQKLTWRLALDYHLSARTMAYLSYNRGFKSGGYNTLVVTLPPFAPETLDAYEIGVKSSIESWLTLNGAAFYYDYKNIQVGRSINGLTGTYNAPGTEIYGADVELRAQPTRALSLTLGYSYVHGRYLDFSGAQVATPLPGGGYSVGTGNVEGNHTILSPEHSVTLGASYNHELGAGILKLDANYSYTSRYYHEPDNVLSQPSYSMLGGTIAYETKAGLTFSLWGKNLTNEAVEVVGGVQTFGTLGLARSAYGEPRTYGVTVSAAF